MGKYKGITSIIKCLLTIQVQIFTPSFQSPQIQENNTDTQKN